MRKIHTNINNMYRTIQLIVGDSQQRWRCWRGVFGRPVTWRQISPSSPRLAPLWSEISQNSKLWHVNITQSKYNSTKVHNIFPYAWWCVVNTSIELNTWLPVECACFVSRCSWVPCGQSVDAYTGTGSNRPTSYDSLSVSPAEVTTKITNSSSVNPHTCNSFNVLKTY